MSRPAGYKHTEETRAKMRAARLGMKYSDATKQKIRAAALARGMFGPRNPAWRGGQTAEPNGRVKVLQADGTYKYRARVVAEEMLGRTLRDNEDVHHKNGIKDDDRPENLEVLDRGEHARVHLSERVRDEVTGRWSS